MDKLKEGTITPSQHPGMGAVLHDDGCTFRVWAPFARSVAVAGSFNAWSASEKPLASEGNGYWSTDVPGVKARDQYKLVLNGNTWKKDPYAKDVTGTGSQDNCIVADPSFDWGRDRFRTPAWNDLVIYELHLGTFNDEAGAPAGNLRTAMDRLDYLRDLGISAIELMPPGEYPGIHSWGYNPSCIFAIESDLGNPLDLKEFIRQAHQRGIAVILDVVYNHFGPADLDLWRFDGWEENGGGGIYFYNDWRRNTPWGDTRPDYGRVEVRQFIRDNALMWLQEYSIDGLRFDSTVNIQKGPGFADIPDGWSLLQWINNEIDARLPWKATIAEDLQKNQWITKTTDAGGAGFDMQWDAGFVHPVRAAVIAAADESRDIYSIRDAICGRYNDDAYERVIYTESHDEVANGRARVPEEISPGAADNWFARKRSTLGAALVFTSPGVPMIFQGQEFLEDQFFRDDIPLDWDRQNRFGGISNLYRDLIRLRRNCGNNTRGLSGQYVNVHHLNNADKVIAFHRWSEGGQGDDVIVVANFSIRSFPDYTVGFPREGTWWVRFNSDYSGYSGDFGNFNGYDTRAESGWCDGMGFKGNVGVGPYSVLILSQ